MLYKGDTLISDNAILYRYNTKKNVIEIFNKTTVLHRKFGALDYHVAFPSGNHEGITVSAEALSVNNRNRMYFYFWTNTDYLESKTICSLFLEASKQYYDDKINKLQAQIDTYTGRFTNIKNFLEKEINFCERLYSKGDSIDKSIT